jgi:hypothetical protein
MVLSGEGSDEVFGGYLYFHKAPNRVGAFLVLWVLGDRWWHASGEDGVQAGWEHCHEMCQKLEGGGSNAAAVASPDATADAVSLVPVLLRLVSLLILWLLLHDT